MPHEWPEGVPRVPDDDWVHREVAPLARGYDQVGDHAWYANLDPSVDEVADAVDDGDVVVDYSGGTGLFTERLLDHLGDAAVGVVVADASAKFLRQALEKLGHDPRVAFRRLRYLRDADRLQMLDEVLEPPLRDGGVDALACTNAVHLYRDLDPTFRAWRRVLRDDALVHVQSGNIDRPGRPSHRWTIDATVDAVAAAARDVVRDAPRFEAHARVLDDQERMEAHRALRHRFFLPVRPLDAYLDALTDARIDPVDVTPRPVRVPLDEWRDFLQVYDAGFLGWIGGTERVEGEPPREGALAQRREVLDLALDRVFGDEDAFEAEWVYVRARAG